MTWEMHIRDKTTKNMGTHRSHKASRAAIRHVMASERVDMRSSGLDIL